MGASTNFRRGGPGPRLAFVHKNAKIKTKSPLVSERARCAHERLGGRGSKSLRPLGRVTARGLTRRFFLERQRFELFSRNQRNQPAERKPLARKSSVLKALDSVPWALPRQIEPPSSIYFPRPLRGGGRSKVWDLQAGTAWVPRASARRFPRNFFCSLHRRSLVEIIPLGHQPA